LAERSTSLPKRALANFTLPSPMRHFASWGFVAHILEPSRGVFNAVRLTVHSHFRQVSRSLGVDRIKRFKAVITVKGKQHFLGYFKTSSEAAQAYDRASIKMRGSQARLNYSRSRYIKSNDELDVATDDVSFSIGETSSELAKNTIAPAAVALPSALVSSTGASLSPSNGVRCKDSR